MSVDSGLNEELIRRLPLPLAKLYRHAANAKSALDRHQAAFFLWEAALKLLAVTEIVIYADRAEHSPKIAEQLKSLARPSLGEWRKYVRLLLPALATEQEEFRKIKALLEQSRDDLPRAAGLDAVLRETLESKSGARSTVRLDELFDRLVTYRNQELGHGAAGLRTPAFYDRMGRSLLAGVGEILQRLDVFADRRLIYVAEVSRAERQLAHRTVRVDRRNVAPPRSARTSFRRRRGRHHPGPRLFGIFHIDSIGRTRCRRPAHVAASAGNVRR